MKIIQNQSLKKYNTFGIEATAKEFVAIQNEAELATVLNKNQQKKLFVLALLVVGMITYAQEGKPREERPRRQF